MTLVGIARQLASKEQRDMTQLECGARLNGDSGDILGLVLGNEVLDALSD